MFGLPRILTVYAIAIPLALVLGYALATPDRMTVMMVGLVLFSLALPIFIKWHHILLILFWNAAFNFPFLPGQPHFWLLLAVLSFGISWLNGLLAGRKFLRGAGTDPSAAFPRYRRRLDGYLRGGIGAQSLGSTSSYGGKSYFYILGAIIGYFALSAVRIPVAKASRAARIYVLSGVSFILATLPSCWARRFIFCFICCLASILETRQLPNREGCRKLLSGLAGLAPPAPRCSATFWCGGGFAASFQLPGPGGWRCSLRRLS